MPSASDLLAALHATAKAIRALEADARAALDNDNDEAAYRAKYHEKVILLQELPELVEPHLDSLPQPLASVVAVRAEGFANRAAQAEAVGSIFYMYALLYPDDYQDGQPNDLEEWIGEVEEELRGRETS